MTRSNCCSSAQVSWWWWRWWGHFPDDQKVLRHFDVLLRHTTPQTHTQKRGQYLNSHSSFVLGGGCFFFFLFGVEAAGLFRATEQLLLSASFSKGMDGWMRKKTLKQKNVSFLSFFLSPSATLSDGAISSVGFYFFSPLKNKTKSQLPLRQLD
jgi:hypothetical protein